MIPKWEKLGFQIMAFTFIKGRDRAIKPGELQTSIKKPTEWFSAEPNVVFDAAGSGLDHSGIIVSFHKRYTTFTNFNRRIRMELSEYISNTTTFMVDLNPCIVSKPLHFKYLSEVK
jgi:hypothetical protein